MSHGRGWGSLLPTTPPAASMKSESADAQNGRRMFGLTIDRRSPSPREKELGVTQTQFKPAVRRRSHRTLVWVGVIACALLLVCAAVIVGVAVRSGPSAGSTQPIRYLGVYERDAPESYAGVSAFSAATGVSPNLVMYYSSWREPFNSGFASSAAKHSAVPLVQMNPAGISLAAIASGQYDTYLTTFAEAVRSYGHPVVLSFGHEMNGENFHDGL